MIGRHECSEYYETILIFKVDFLLWWKPTWFTLPVICISLLRRALSTSVSLGCPYILQTNSEATSMLTLPSSSPMLMNRLRNRPVASFSTISSGLTFPFLKFEGYILNKDMVECYFYRVFRKKVSSPSFSDDTCMFLFWNMLLHHLAWY